MPGMTAASLAMFPRRTLDCCMHCPSPHATYCTCAGCCDPFNDKALRASRGAAFKLPLSSGDWQGLQQVLHYHKMTCLAAQPAEDLAGKLVRWAL